MTLISIVALGVAVGCLCFCQFMNLKIMKTQSERIKALERFVYPEFKEYRDELVRKAYDRSS